MKTPHKKSAFFAAILCATGIAGLLLAHAQSADTVATSSATLRKHKPLISPELAAQLQAVEQLPTVAADSVPKYNGTFYSAQCPYWPPLPGNVLELPMWDLGDGHYMVNDLAIDYAALDASATESTSLRFSPMESNLLSYDLSSGVPVLSIASTGASQVTVTILNGITNAVYEIYGVEFLTDTNWMLLAEGTPGQTNFIFATDQTDTGFFQASNGNDFDGDGIPNWSDARPFDPAIGLMTVTIEKPAIGSNVQ